MKKSEISLTEIFRILKQRKWFVILPILFFIIVALIYNAFTDPVYESTVLVKKEMLFDDNDPQDRLKSLLGYVSNDEVETEMQLVQTRSVINSVIEDLSLNVFINKIEEQDGTVTIIDLPLSEYKNEFNYGNYAATFPQINKINVGLNTVEDNFIVEKLNDESFDISVSNTSAERNHEMKNQIKKSQDWEFDIIWPGNSSGGKIHFEVLDYNLLFGDISENIFVDKKIKTNIFEVAVNSNYPFSTKAIANTLVQNYQSDRFTLNKDNIRYSSEFIIERLEEITKKLAAAEDSLSKFKTKENIADIDEQSKNIVQFLSNLETEKLNNDLELGIYNNRMKNISKQMKNNGFVDQTYLTPEQYQTFNSPFSTALTDLARLELEKLELLQRRTEFHPDVKAITEQIQQIEKNLTKYNTNTLNAISILSNSLKNKKNDLNKLIAKYTAKLQELPQQESKLASLIRDRDGLENMFNLLTEKREEMRVAELSKLQDVVVIEPAVEADKPISPRKKLNLLAGAFLGLILGLILAFIVNFSDKKVNNIYDIERNFNFPILSVVPPFENDTESRTTEENIESKFVTLQEDNFKYKEAYRRLETKIMSNSEDSPKVVMITSCEENAGKTTSAANLAISAAQSGKKILLIDCDIKNPSIADRFGLPKFSSGLIDYLTENTTTPSIYKPVKLTKNSSLLMNLDIIPTGVFSNISGEILASNQMKKLLDDLKYYDLVILDTPPLTKLADALALGRLVKETILVVRPGQTDKDSINWAISELKSADTKFLGVLVNDCDAKDSNTPYKYGYVNS